jgi:hypothetical protein
MQSPQVVGVPSGVELSAEEVTLFQQWSGAREASEWRVPDLLILCKIAQAEVDLRRYKSMLRSTGPVVKRANGSAAPNPLLGIIDEVERRQLSLCRSLGLFRISGDARTVNARAPSAIDYVPVAAQNSDNVIDWGAIARQERAAARKKK